MVGEHVVIRSTGMYLPEIEVSNQVLRARHDASESELFDKLEATTGIATRWYAPDAWATSDLAVRAARHALHRAGVAPEELDLVIVGTDSPDYITPSTSVIVQHKLGATRAGTFDIGCACASFPTALASAAGIMKMNPSMKHVVVVGAYMMHKLADPQDINAFFYGDGAGAAVLTRSTKPGVLGSAYRADGAYSKHWGIYSGGTAEPASEQAIRDGRTMVRMVEKYPPQINDEGWPAIMHRLAEVNGFALSDVDLVIFTQVRKRTIEKAMGVLGLPMDKTHMVMTKWGYTGSACIPMALHDAIEAGKVRVGDLVVLVGSGVGHNQAGIALRVTPELVR